MRKFLSQRTVMPYSATPPKPAIRRSSSGSISESTSRTGANGTRSPAIVMPERRGVERLDLEPVDADHGVAVVDEVVREREPRGSESDDQHALAGRGQRHRLRKVERIPAREQRIDLEAPGQREHVLQHARLGLRNVDRVLLLVDARLHAVVADAMPGRRRHRVVDADHRERAERPAFRAQLVELGDALLERASGQRHVERRLLERHVAGQRLLLEKPGRARVLALLVAPDAVVRLVEPADEVGAGIGEREAVALAQRVMRVELPRRHAVARLGFHRHELHVVELARRAEQHAAAMRGLACRRVRRPRRVAQRDVDLRGECAASSACQRVTACAKPSSENGAPIAASSAARNAGPSKRRSLVGLVRVHGLALHELALDGEDRRELVVPRLERAHLLVDAEQRRARKSSTCGATAIRSSDSALRSSDAGAARAAARRAASAHRRPARCSTKRASMRAAPSTE